MSAAMARHPRVPMALKAAVAASLAWLVVLPIGGVADDYPYYAPFGAVIAVSATVARSWRISLQSIGGIIAGAALALVAAWLPIEPVLELAIVVGGGILLAGWTRLGQGGEWVPLSGMFVLIVGSADRLDYVTAYVGLTALGALIGIGFNLLWPPLPLISAEHSLERLRATLAEQLEALAGGLSHDDPPTPQEWRQFRHDIGPRAAEMRQMASQADESRWANWRAMRWRDASDRQSQSARGMDKLALVVEGLTALVVDSEHAGREVMALGPTLRAPAAAALRSTAALMRSDANGAREDRFAQAEAATESLASAVLQVQRESGDDIFAAGAVVTSLRQIIVQLQGWPGRARG